MSAREYTIAVRQALMISRPSIYEGKDGALRLAREYGSALADSPANEAEQEMINAVSYNDICVIGYYLQPPLNVKEWQDEVRTAYIKARMETR